MNNPGKPGHPDVRDVEALLNAKIKWDLYIQIRSDLRAELLLRAWRADGTVIPPFLFVQVAQHTGLSTELDIHIGRRCIQIAHLIAAEATEVPLKMNICRGTVDDGGEQLLNLLHQARGEDGNLLVGLEIPETIPLTQNLIMLAHDACRAGVEVSLDDATDAKASGQRYDNLARYTSEVKFSLAADGVIMSCLDRAKGINDPNPEKRLNAQAALHQLAPRLRMLRNAGRGGKTIVIEQGDRDNLAGIFTDLLRRCGVPSGAIAFQNFNIHKPQPVDQAIEFIRRHPRYAERRKAVEEHRQKSPQAP